MGRLNLLGGQINLLGGQMPTQLTCYLPPWEEEEEVEDFTSDGFHTIQTVISAVGFTQA